jgi:multiple sugar transport system permease protein
VHSRVYEFESTGSPQRLQSSQRKEAAHMKHSSKINGQLVSTVLKYALLIAVSIIMVFPFYWMINMSLKTGTEVYQYPPTIIPQSPTLQNYETVLRHTNYPRYFLNSLWIAAVETALLAVITVLCAFGLYRIKFKGKNLLFNFLLIISSLPFEVVMVFNYKMMVAWGLNDTYTALILPFLANFFYVYILYNAFTSIPNEIVISAGLDHASDLKFLTQIALPMVRPTIIYICIMNMIGSWNSFVWPLLITNSEEMRTVSFGIYSFMSEIGSQSELVMAMSVITEIPLIIVFLLSRKHFLSGKYN